MAARRADRTTRATPRPKSGPSEIAPGVFVGGWKDATRFAGARFCVLDEAPDELEKEIPGATHVPIYDDRGDRALVPNLDRLVERMRKAREAEEPVLVFCGHGIRRSPLAGAWYLHRAQGIPLDEAYDRVRSVRPRVEHAREWIGHASELA